MSTKSNLFLDCEWCGCKIDLERGCWAMDKYGEVTCRRCHWNMILFPELFGGRWQGVTFGYDREPSILQR